MITILDTSLRPVAILEDYYADEISEQINGSYTFKFSILMNDDKSRYIAINNIVEAEGQYFNIIHHRRSRSDNGEILIAVNCEQVSYNLLYHVFEGGFIHTNTPWVLMNMALEGTGFMVGAVQHYQYVSIDLKEGINARGVLMEIAAQTGCELYFDKYAVSLLARRGQDRGVQFRLGKNLKGIVKDVNGQSGEVLTAYEIDVVELNTLSEFEGLEYFELGDTVDIIDEELGINEQQRIIEYSYSPKRRINSKVTIANYIEGIQDTIYRIQTTTVNKDKYYYGTRIGPENGFESIRWDNKARTVMNADEFRMQKGDGSGSFTDALFFDPQNDVYKFNGELQAASGTFTGDLSAAGGTFSGMLTAASGTFTGTVTAGTIDGSYIYGGQIYGTYIEGADILGSRIRTRAYGSRVELDVDGMEFYDDNDVRRVTLGTHPGANISGHTYYNNYGQSQGLIYAIDDALHLIGTNELFLRGHGKITVQGVIDFSDATVIGL
ncbi:phage tail spike protein [Paenibacillus glucanolyticus]|uniref:phage tail spike protein n=1 Tax=Paenibacillus glucanolyticus TaxID=59843 RepID=UPI0034CE8E42